MLSSAGELKLTQQKTNYSFARQTLIAMVALASLVLSTGTNPQWTLAEDSDTVAAKPLAVGQIAPDWTLLDQNGKPVSLHDFRDKQNVVVFFFWKDDGPVCTKESCSFRDSFAKFNVQNAAVIGISSDSQERHKKFKDDNKIPYELLSDADGKVRALWGVPTESGMPGRFTYVIDKKGVVRKVYGAMYQDKKHVVEALKALGDFNFSAY